MAFDSETLGKFDKWVKEELSPTMSDFQHALLPYVKAIRETANTMAPALRKFLQDNEETLRALVQFSEVYPKLEPYFDSISANLQNPEFDIANDVVEFAHILAAIDFEIDPNAFDVLAVIKTPEFSESLLKAYKSSRLKSDRMRVIEQAIELHNNGQFFGSVALSYGLIEGVLTESFEISNYMIQEGRSFKPLDGAGQKGKPKLTGLVPKLEHAITHKDQLSAYYQKIISYQLINGDQEKTIPMTRNAVLHGNDLEFGTEKRSGQLLLWLYSAILHVRALGI